jgi:hypothetical protein
MLGHYLANLARFGRIDPIEYYVDDAHRCIYVENAKVACTAIKQVLYPKIAAEITDQDAFHEAVRPLARHHVPSRLRGYFVFTVVRDPKERLESAYRDKIMGQGASGEPGILQSRFHRTIFRLFGKVDTADPALELDEFAAAVKRVPDFLRDRHIRDQRVIERAVERSRNGFIARLEAMDAGWAHIRAQTGLPELPVANRTSSS